MTTQKKVLTTEQLDFNQAMTDFQKMFPSMECQVIETVLRSNNGAVDATINNLLCLSADSRNGADTVRNPSNVVGHSLSNDLSGLSLVPTPRMLQLSYENNIRLSSHNNHDEQLMEDERIAIMMQNEEFLIQLRLDRGFMMTLENDRQETLSRNEGASSLRLIDDEDAFVERLRNMGKQSKRKFSQIANLFSSKARSARGGSLLIPQCPSSDNSSLKEDEQVFLNPNEQSDNDSDHEDDNLDGTKSSENYRRIFFKGKYTSF